jgi:hypothetical protein
MHPRGPPKVRTLRSQVLYIHVSIVTGQIRIAIRIGKWLLVFGVGRRVF